MITADALARALSRVTVTPFGCWARRQRHQDQNRAAVQRYRATRGSAA